MRAALAQALPRPPPAELAPGPGTLAPLRPRGPARRRRGSIALAVPPLVRDPEVTGIAHAGPRPVLRRLPVEGLELAGAPGRPSTPLVSLAGLDLVGRLRGAVGIEAIPRSALDLPLAEIHAVSPGAPGTPCRIS